MVDNQGYMKDGSILDEAPPDYMAMIEKLLAESPLRSFESEPLPQKVDAPSPLQVGDRIIIRLEGEETVIGTVTSPVRTEDGAITFDITPD
ncbi:hypothetical protein QNA24_22470 [Rhodococcus qingshengii]|uniref:hypothetical protein n=1 Tax=Rhodococcus qingshengii TaxID=334542 RepID=UPI0024BAFD6D|nr:hypothetical protein [Rhodococcus qingshengii]MDJ0489143.1 hypothetical protein [Rhodococcus qingshengii]